MSAHEQEQSDSRSLEAIFKEHLENTVICRRTLYDLFSNIKDPIPYIAKVKQLEEQGDKLTAEAYYALDAAPFSALTHVIVELVKLLDDIVDGFNKTARLIDICQPKHIEEAAFDILAEQQAMIERLQQEIDRYPDNDPTSLRACCNALKEKEENVDLIYHEWRKKERRNLTLALIEESNWTEIFGVLEQTTDDIYHAAIVLESIARTRHRGGMESR